jgi:hypothetical protein
LSAFPYGEGARRAEEGYKTLFSLAALASFSSEKPITAFYVLGWSPDQTRYLTAGLPAFF